MKRLIKYHIYFGLFLGLLVAGCKKDKTSSTTVYMPAGKAIVSQTFDITDTILYSASLVGADYPTLTTMAANNINVTFKADPSLIAAFNTANHTNYGALPADNFSFETTATIAKGQSATGPLKLIIKNGDKLSAFSSFLLPIRIDQANGGSISSVQKVTYFVVTRSPSLANLTPFDRSKWSIAGFSTQEPAEGSGNGLGIDAIDGDLGSYWQSKWSGGEPGPPHYIAIDMGEVKEIHAISIVDRDFSGDWAVNGHGQPKAMTVSVSTDGTNWTDNGTFQVPIVEPQAEIRFFLPQFLPVRYFRITVTDVWGSNSTNIAEIYAL
jgi:hypothetical protein